MMSRWFFILLILLAPFTVEAQYTYFSYEEFEGTTAVFSSNADTIFIGDRNADNTGKVTILKNEGGNWIELNSFSGRNFSDKYGHDISLSADGNSLIVSAPFADEGGRADIYKKVGGVWMLSDSIVRPTRINLVTQNSDGSLVVVCNVHYADEVVHFYEKENDEWKKVDSLTAVKTGYPGGMALNKDGNILAIGLEDAENNYTGKVVFYEKIGDSWQISATLTGENEKDYFGSSLSWSPDGNTIVVTASGGEGEARVYKKIDGAWTEISKVSGTSDFKIVNGVAISSDEELLAVGGRKRLVSETFIRIYTGYPCPDTASWVSTLPTFDKMTPYEADTFTIPKLFYSNGQSGSEEISGSVEGVKTKDTLGYFYNDCGGTFHLSWEFIDTCDRKLSYEQTIVVDTAPAYTWYHVPSDTILTPSQADDYFVKAIYEGERPLYFNISPKRTAAYDLCGGTITHEWSVLNPCNRGEITAKQIVTVDTAAKASWINPPQDVTLSTLQADTFTFTDLFYTNGQTGTGEISGSVSGVKTGSYDDWCGGALYVDWEYTDDCGRKITHKQTVTVVAVPQANWTSTPADVTLSPSKADAYTFDDLLYSNGKTNTEEISGSIEPEITGSYDRCGGLLKASWEFIDTCDRKITHQQIVTVDPVTQASFVNPPGDRTISLVQANSFSAPALVCTNGLSGKDAISATVVPSIKRNFSNCGGEILVSWDYTDNCGRTSSHQQKISVEPLVPPSFQSIPKNITISCPEYQEYISPVLIFTNNQSGNYLISGTLEAEVESVDDPCGSGFTESWSYTDVCGRVLSHSRYVTVTATCSDGIQNQGEEQIDCGGPCISCATCDDGIQNQGEKGIDCGGPCAVVCPDCPIPATLRTNMNVSNSSVSLSWTSLANATKYIVQIREVGGNKWYRFQTRETTLSIRGLAKETSYEWQVYGDCDILRSNWSSLCQFSSASSAPVTCIEPPSCEDGIQNQGEEGKDCGGPCEPCFTCDIPMEVYASKIGGDSATLYWEAVKNVSEYVVQVKVRDSLNWDSYVTTDNFLQLHGLAIEAEYDWRVQTRCQAIESDWSDACGFISNYPESGDCAVESIPEPTCSDGIQNQGEDGIDCGGPCDRCPGCYVPVNVYAGDIQAGRVTLYWTGTEWDDTYKVRVRLAGTENWYNFTTRDLSLSIRGISDNTVYEWQVQAGCSEEESGWTEICSFNSSDPYSGDCSEPTQPGTPSCSDGIQNQGEDGIDCGGPCGNCVTCEVEVPDNLFAEVAINNTAMLHWDAVADAFTYTLRVKIGTGDWEVYETTMNAFLLEELIPWQVYEWQVSASCEESTSDWSAACGFIANDPETGNCDIEPAPTCDDNIQNQGEEGIDCGGACAACEPEEPACPAPDELSVNVFSLGFFNIVTLSWRNVSGANGYNLRYKSQGSGSWTTVSTGRSRYVLFRIPRTTYEWEVQTVCGGDVGNWTRGNNFNVGNRIGGLSSPIGSQTLPSDFRVFPNPASTRLTISFERPLESDQQVVVVNFLGQVVSQEMLKAGVSQTTLEVGSLPRGVYFLRVSGMNNVTKAPLKLMRFVLQ